jgi:hypothetical protein
MGDVGVTFRLTDRIRISDTFRANNFRIDGGNEVAEALFRTRILQGNEVPVLPLITDTAALRTINYRRYLNLLEGDIEIHPRFTLHLGYRFTDRRVEQRAQDVNLITPESSPSRRPICSPTRRTPLSSASAPSH